MNKQQFLGLGLTEEQATKAETESKKELEGYVEKSKFDTVSQSNKDLEKTVKDRDKQLEDLKKSSGDNEALKAQIETLQTDNKAAKEKFESDLKDLQLSNAIKLSIADKAHDTDLVASQIDKSKLLLSDDGKVTGLDEQLKDLQTNKAFLFKPIENNQDSKPQPGFQVGVDGQHQQQTPQNLSLSEAIAQKISFN
jgi:hypothetical protein